MQKDCWCIWNSFPHFLGRTVSPAPDLFEWDFCVLLKRIHFNENGHSNQLRSSEACVGSLELRIEKCIPTPCLVVGRLCCNSFLPWLHQSKPRESVCRCWGGRWRKAMEERDKRRTHWQSSPLFLVSWRLFTFNVPIHTLYKLSQLV